LFLRLGWGSHEFFDKHGLIEGPCDIRVESGNEAKPTPLATTSSTLRLRISPAQGTLVLLIGLNLLNYIDRYILPGEVSLIQHEFHATDQQMGALTTALFIFYMFAAPLTGWLGDWFPRKPLIIAGAVLWSLATLATAWVHDYTTLYIRHALVGVGEATFGIFAPAVLADFYPERDRNRILSIFYLAIPVGAALGYLAGGQLGPLWGWRAPFFLCAIPGLVIAALYGLWGREPERGASDRVRPIRKETTFWRSVVEFIRKVLKLFTNPAYLTATFGLATLTFAMGGISAWVPEFLRRSVGLTVGASSQVVGAITVIDGIAGTLIGGWIAQRWSRTNHRALYLLSFWSVALTLPCGILIFFGPAAWAIPALFAAEFFLFLNTGPLNTAIVNSVSGPIRATAIACNLFIIHCFGDTFSPQIIGFISDRAGSLRLALGATLIALVVSSVILRAGARFAPPLEDTASGF
jgi:MFS family permease